MQYVYFNASNCFCIKLNSSSVCGNSAPQRTDTMTPEWWKKSKTGECSMFLGILVETSCSLMTGIFPQPYKTHAHPGSSWQTQLRGQAAYVSCARRGWHWHQMCPQGKYRYWYPSVLPFSSASWWLKHWRSKVLGVSLVAPMPAAVCFWIIRPWSCTAAGEWWYGPANRHRCQSFESQTTLLYVQQVLTKIKSLQFFFLTMQTRYG